MAPPGPPDWGELPEELLCRVLSLAGRDQGPIVTLVNRRWRSCFYAEPSLWRSLEIRPGTLAALSAPDKRGWFAGKLRLVRLVGPLLQELRLVDAEAVIEDAAGSTPGAWRLADLLRCLEAREFSSLAIIRNLGRDVFEDGFPFPELHRLMQTTKLDLAAGRLTHAAQLLGGLTQLRHLSCIFGNPPPDEFASVVAQLAHLATLKLYAPAFPPLQSLTRLQHLRHCSLWCHWGPDAPLPSPSLFPRLESCSLKAIWGRLLEVEGCLLKSCSLTEAVGLGVRGFHLRLGGVQRMQSLEQLLEAMGGAVAPMIALDLVESHLPEPALRHCSHALSNVRWLRLPNCSFGDGGADAALQTMLPQAARLSMLGLAGCLRGTLSARSRAGTTGLEALILANNDLTQIPAGGYLTGLTHLDLSRNAFRHLPPALASAAALQHLLLSGNTGLELTGDDVSGGGVLARLPHLERIELDAEAASCMPASVRQFLGSRLEISTAWAGA